MEAYLTGTASGDGSSDGPAFFDRPFESVRGTAVHGTAVHDLLDSYRDTEDGLARHLPLLGLSSRIKWIALAVFWMMLARASQGYLHPISTADRLALFPRWIGSVRLLPASMLCIGAWTIMLGAVPGLTLLLVGPTILEGRIHFDEEEQGQEGMPENNDPLVMAMLQWSTVERRLRPSVLVGAAVAAAGLCVVMGHVAVVTAQLTCPVDAGLISKRDKKLLDMKAK